MRGWVELAEPLGIVANYRLSLLGWVFDLPWPIQGHAESLLWCRVVKPPPLPFLGSKQASVVFPSSSPLIPASSSPSPVFASPHLLLSASLFVCFLCLPHRQAKQRGDRGCRMAGSTSLLLVLFVLVAQNAFCVPAQQSQSSSIIDPGLPIDVTPQPEQGLSSVCVCVCVCVCQCKSG